MTTDDNLFMRHQLKIEPPQPNDLDAVLRVAQSTRVFTADELAVVQEMFDGIFHPNTYNDHTFLVYRKNDSNKIAGFIVYGPVPMADRIWDLYWIGVDRAAQGAGIGGALLEQLEKDITRRGARALYLETSDSALYQPARTFYERHGFECVAHLPDYYAPGESMLIYRKRLA
jgi:ribosomal protein S18 acetylase RimI-like enzyme